MKNSQKGFVVPLLIIISVLVIGGGLAYARNIGLIDIFISPEEKENRQTQRIKNEFPNTIQTYQLTSYNIDKIDVRSECVDIEKVKDFKSLGLTGNVCQKRYVAQYKDNSTGNVVFIHASKSQQSELLRTLIQRISTSDMLGNNPIFRIESHEIGWLPNSTFDVIITQEGVFKNSGITYSEKASGNNPVTKYFIEKFPPKTNQ